MNEIEYSSPAVIAPPIGRYSHLVRVPANAEWVFISGQVGQDQAGVVPDGVYEQTMLVFENIERLLGSLDAVPTDIVRLLTFLVAADDMAEFARARDVVYKRWYGDGPVPGHSLAVAAALARADLRIEMEGWVALAPSVERAVEAHA